MSKIGPHTLDVDYDDGASMHSCGLDSGRTLRKKQCKECGEVYTTIEVEVPVSFHRVATNAIDRSKADHRKRYGFKGQFQRKTRKPTIVVAVRVHDPKAK